MLANFTPWPGCPSQHTLTWVSSKRTQQPPCSLEGRVPAKEQCPGSRSTEFTPSLHSWATQWPSLLCHTQHLGTGTSELLRAGDFSTDSHQGCRAFPPVSAICKICRRSHACSQGTRTASMAWGWSQGSHCHQISEPSKCFKIRVPIPTVQARQLKQSSTGMAARIGQLLAQLLSLEMGHIKVLYKIPQQNSPWAQEMTELSMAPLGMHSASPDVHIQLPQVLLLHTWCPANRQRESQALKKTQPLDVGEK